MGLELKFTRDLRGIFVGLGDRINARQQRLLLKAATIAGGEIAKEAATSFRGGTGALGRSFLPAKLIRDDDGNIAGAATSDLPYAAIQNEGGTILPRTVRHLAIPLTAQARGRWPRDWPEGELIFLVSKTARNKLLATRTGKGKLAKIIPQYVLKDSVQIPGTGYLDRAADNAEPQIEALIATEMGETIDEVSE